MLRRSRSTYFWFLTSFLSGSVVCSVLGASGLYLPLTTIAAAVFAGLGLALVLRSGGPGTPAVDHPGDAAVARLAGSCYETTVRVIYAGRVAGGTVIEALKSTESLLAGCDRLRTGLTRAKGISLGRAGGRLSANDSGNDMPAVSVVAKGDGPSGLMLREVMSTVREMSVVLRDVGHNARELITSTEETVYSMSKLDSFLQDMASSGRDLESSTDTANRIALEGTKVVEEMGRENEAIITTVNEAASAVEDLGRWSQEVGKIVEVIRDIADETNLLALNASIIAAQSGEHGKAFGVVAEEIRGLAERTSSSTKEISDLVKAVQKNVANVVNSMKKSLQRVERGELLTRNAGMVLEKVFESFESSKNLAKQIASSTFEHKIDSSQVVRSLHKVTDIARRLQSHDYAGWAGASETVGMMRALSAMGSPPEGPHDRGGGRSCGEHNLDSDDSRPGSGDLWSLLDACDGEITACTDSLRRTREVLAGWLRSLVQASKTAASGLTQASGHRRISELDACWDIVECDRKMRKRCPAHRQGNPSLFFSAGAACMAWAKHADEEAARNGPSSDKALQSGRVAHKVG